MANETITKVQGVCIITVFIMGVFVVTNISSEAEQDTWVSLLLAAACFIPLLLVYARITKLYPEKDIFQIIGTLFGKVTAKALTALLFWYCAHLFALVVRNLSDFINVISLPKTPFLPIMIIMVLVAAYIAKCGVECLGKWCVAALGILALFVLVTVLLSLNKIDLTNIQPVLSHDAGAIATTAFEQLTFPLAETVLFLGVANAIKKTDNARSMYMLGTAFGTLMLLTVIIRNITLLGVPMSKAEYFSSYIAIRVISLGDVLTRMEGLISANFILSAFTKSALCLLVAAKAASALFSVRDYRKLVMPVGLFSLALSAILYKNVMEMFAFFKTYSYYALPFQVGIPLIIWIKAEVRSRKAVKKA